LPLLALAVLMLGFAPAPFPRSDRRKSNQSDLERCQGTWVRVQLHIDGQPRNEGPNGTTITITSNRLQFPVASDAWFISLDETKRPRQITYRGATDTVRRHVFRGVYRLEGDTLTICCRDGEEKDRPLDLSATGQGIWLQVFKRRKP
jgi:uncharacterized protein (TIGR03067 family)